MMARRREKQRAWLRMILYGVILYVVSTALLLYSARLTEEASMSQHMIASMMPSNLTTSLRTKYPSSSQVESWSSSPLYKDPTKIGVLSHKDPSFFRALQQEIDDEDPHVRCARYGLIPNKRRRQIFWGSLIADEPAELLEIAAAESYGILDSIVWVEGNLTQNFTPRTFRHLQSAEAVKRLFGARQVKIMPFVNEEATLEGLAREHAQRALILQGWKELGMTPDDVGILSDADETFTRDYLRALETCHFRQLDADTHDCDYNHVKLTAVTRVYEGSPECITKGRTWFHPDVISGHCIEGISDHDPAPRTKDTLNNRDSFHRLEGYGKHCRQFNHTLHDTHNHSWNAADFRRTCGGGSVQLSNTTVLWRSQHKLSRYTAFHFHNFFSQFKMTRFKYLTYGHPDKNVMQKPMHNISNDLHMMVHCAKGELDHSDQRWKRVIGGFNAHEPFWPIYFQDGDYRARRHKFLQDMVAEDEAFMKNYTVSKIKTS